MENKKIFDDKIEGIVTYLISLFYKTDCKYYCYMTKINRLLAIYKLCTLKYNNDALYFDFFVTDKGMGISNLFAYVDRDECLGQCVVEDNKPINDKFNESYYLPKYICNISEQTKILLEMIFRKFGNYNGADLQNQLQQIREDIPKKDINQSYVGILDKPATSSLIRKDSFVNFINNCDIDSLYKDNEVLKFIKNFDNTNINIFYDENSENKKITNEIIEKLKNIDLETKKELLLFLKNISNSENDVLDMYKYVEKTKK